MSELKERLDNLRALMQEPEFLEGKGLSNEVNIRIFCYDPSDEMMVRHFIKQIMTDQSMNCHLIEHNLYEVFLSICEDKRIAKTIPAMEEKKGKEFIRDQMSRMANNTAFVNKMKYEPHEAGDVLVTTGVGDAFPFIRVHDLLNAMQPEFPDVPILVFYPGNYDGRDVQLFNRLKKNPYEVVYGKDTLDENLKFIADALGGKGQPKDVIRNYFLNDFYSDHCKIYQKRPIYWLFDSGKKNGFKALIYMHRYQPDTIARIRTDYVHEQQARYRTAIADLETRIANASPGERVKLNKQLKTLNDQATEIHEYEEKIHHLADQMISIDLDDGVKKNYAIFQDVLAKIK